MAAAPPPAAGAGAPDLVQAPDHSPGDADDVLEVVSLQRGTQRDAAERARVVHGGEPRCANAGRLIS